MKIVNKDQNLESDVEVERNLLDGSFCNLLFVIERIQYIKIQFVIVYCNLMNMRKKWEIVVYSENRLNFLNDVNVVFLKIYIIVNGNDIFL